MKDKLEITGLAVETRIGVHAWEQQIKQRLVLDIRLSIDAGNCQDNIENALDYDALCQAISAFVGGQSFQLIETVAHETALLIKKQFALEHPVTLTVKKPGAIAAAQTVAVTVER